MSQSDNFVLYRANALVDIYKKTIFLRKYLPSNFLPSRNGPVSEALSFRNQVPKHFYM